MAKKPEWTTPSIRGLAYGYSPISENVDSSAIARIGYDPGDQKLVVTFNSGRSYAYFGVSRQRYTAFEHAGSKGRYFNSAIRDKYAFRRLG